MSTAVKFLNVIPTLSVTDLSQVDDFYARLDFVQDWIWPDDSPTHASYRIQEQSLMFTQQKDRNLIHPADLYFIVTGVRALHKQYVIKGLDVSHLFETDYGMIDFSLNDPWGHLLVFGQALNST